MYLNEIQCNRFICFLVSLILFTHGGDIYCKLGSNTREFVGLASENQETALWKSVVAEGKCKGMSRRHEGSENGRRRKSTRQREAKINGFVLSAFFQAF